MNQSNFFKPADRIAHSKPYFFASLGKKISQLKAEGMDIIRIDMGSPDLPPPQSIIDHLCKVAMDKKAHGYSPYGGPLNLKLAGAEYYQKRFNVTLDPEKETIVLIGSKEGLFNMTQIIVNPGDIVLVPDPGYPVYTDSTLIAGGQIYSMPLIKENGFLPDFDRIPENIAKKARLMWLNFPNNPTGAVATLEFFQKAVDFARKNEIIIAHDNPYVDICFGDYIAPSIMQVEGAKELAVEFTSLSKTYNMAGWRVGLAVGPAEIIRYLNMYKSQLDSSQFIPILESAVFALTGDQSWLKTRNEIYQKRRDIVVEGLRKVGFQVDSPPAAIYVWAKLPEKYSDSIQFCEQLLQATGVSCTPGVVYGEYGHGYIRVSLGTDTDRMHEAIHRIVNWMSTKGN